MYYSTMVEGMEEADEVLGNWGEGGWVISDSVEVWKCGIKQAKYASEIIEVDHNNHRARSSCRFHGSSSNCCVHSM